jgi:hypothetical protein
MGASRVALLAAGAVILGSLVAAPALAAPPAPGGVSGTITTNNEATPVVGATVYLRPVSSLLGQNFTTVATPSDAVTVVTDAEGNYSFANVPVGRYNVVASAAGYATPSPGFTAALVKQGATTIDVNLDLVTSSTISGVVKDAAGQPISGATVFAVNKTLYDAFNNWPGNQLPLDEALRAVYSVYSPLGAAGWHSAAPGVGVSGADGSYTIDGLLPGTYLVQTAALGHVSPPGATITVGTTGQVNFDYPAGATIKGKVTAVDGSPLQGVAVYDLGLVDQADPVLPWPVEAVTGADGTYSITGFAAGSSPDMELQAAGHTFGNSPLVDIATATSTVEVNFVAPGDGSITGTVTDQFGNPVAGVTVLFSGTLLDAYAVTDANGHYSVDGLANDTYLAQLLPLGGAYADASSVAVSDTTKHATLDFAATRQGRISGYVRNSEGAPVYGATVNARSTAPNAHGASAFTGPDGSYEINTLDAASYSVIAEAHDSAVNVPLSVDASPIGVDQVLDIQLRPLSSATVPGKPKFTVTAGVESISAFNAAAVSDGGNPVTKYVVTASPGSHKCESLNGMCSFKGLNDDTAYTVKVTAVNQVGASAAFTTVVRTKITGPVTAIKVKAVKGGKAVLTFKPPHTTGVIKDYTLHYLVNGKWKVYKHKASSKPTLSVTGLSAKKSFKAYLTPVLKTGRAANSAYFTLKTG